ncbi:hypothetical protein [Microbacterium sp. MYb62]|uniref:hypothetical protein n=1 Tax=Microbacterium sp. MYb62 TaxID=1848690 RepID=UPI0011B0EB4F|nr:hypothetical protein [Microbacterium sp. MYb62]
MARPRVATVLLIVFGAIAAIVAVASLANAAEDGPLLGCGVLAAIIAVYAFVFAGYGHRFSRIASEQAPSTVLLTWLVMMGSLLCVLGALVMFFVSVSLGSQGSVVAVILLLVTFVVSIASARVLRAHVVRTKAPAAGD